MFYLPSCIHEAAHCVVGELLGHRVAEVLVRADGSGATRYVTSSNGVQVESVADAAEIGRIRAHVDAMDPYELQDRAIETLQRVWTDDSNIRDLLTRAAAGRIAEQRVTSVEAARPGAAGDLHWEWTYVRCLSDRARHPDLEWALARSRAEHLVEKHWSAIMHLAARLMTKGTLSGDEVRTILASHSIKSEAVAA